MYQESLAINKTKFFAIIASLVLLISTSLSSVTHAQEETDYQQLGEDILKAFDYNEATNEYTFDQEKAQEYAGINQAEAQEVDTFLSLLSPEILSELNYALEVSNTDGPIPYIPPLFALIGAAAVSIISAVGAAVAAEFAADIYNYGMTQACENFQGYEAIADFCETNGYI